MSLNRVIFWLFLAFCSAHCADVNAGIEFFMSADAFAQAARGGEKVLLDYLTKNPPKLPDQSVTRIVELTNITIVDVSIGTFSLTTVASTSKAPGGFKISITDLAATVQFTLNKTPGKYLKVSKVTLVATIYAQIDPKSPGHLQITLDDKDYELTVGVVEDDLPFEVRPLVALLIKVAAKREFAAAIKQTGDKLSKMDMHVFLDPHNLTAVDVSLVTLDITPDITVGVNGITNLAVGTLCPFASPQLTNTGTESVRAMLGEAVLGCAGWALQTAGVLDTTINAELPALLKLDGRVGLDVDITSVGPITVTPAQGLSATVALDAVFSKHVYGTERFITVDTNLSTSVTELGLRIEKGVNGSIVGKMGGFTVGLAVSQLAADFPPNFAQQINATNFTALSEQAGQFLNQNIVPVVNNLLAAGIRLPAIADLVTPMLDSPQISFQPGFVLFETNIVPNPVVKSVSEDAQPPENLKEAAPVLRLVASPRSMAFTQA